MAKKKKILLESMEHYVDSIYYSLNEEQGLPKYITGNLKHNLRHYQNSAIRNLLIILKAFQVEGSETYEVFRDFKEVNQFLFRMATGSGKTDVMAASILALYKEKQVKRFLFTTNLKSVLNKTFDNLIDDLSEKYLFSPRIIIDGFTVKIVHVGENEDFPEIEPNTIYIKIASIQTLSNQLDESKAREGRSSLDNIASENIALLVDEAHHFNANATVQKIESKQNPAAFESTMDTIRNTVKSNSKYVIQLEFTATLPFGTKGKERKVRDKYLDKLLYNYTLKEFVIKDRMGNGGYGKHLSQIEANETIESKMLTGILINQYRKYLARKNEFINFKPVILFKSNNIGPSFEAQATFENLVENLTVKQLDDHVNTNLRGTTSQAINWFLNFYDNINDKFDFIESLKSDFLGHILNANDDKNEDRLLNNLNTLDQIDNPYRAVFAVEKVSEGWDVLNLYDIVRVSERGKKANTNAEAQLVGRGSRYYPLVSKNGEIFKRQTFDVTDERVMLETFHYHTIQDSDYLEQLSESYSALGIPIELDKPPVTYSTVLKPEFKKEYFYQYGYFMENGKTEPKEEDYIDLESYGFKNGFKYRPSSVIRERQVFKEDKEELLQPVPKRIERKYIIEAMSRIPFYRFNIMKKYMPQLISKRAFIDGEEWLGKWDHIIEFQVEENNALTDEAILQGTIEFLSRLADLIRRNYMKPRGTKHFVKVPAKKRLINYYERSFKQDSKSITEIRPLSMENKPWSPYTNIIADKLERSMVKMIEENIMPDLIEKYERVYLIRNDEIFNKVGIYEYDGTRRYLPDFILYLLHKETSKVTQIYLEPKGRGFIENDLWKQRILKSLGNDVEIVMETSNDEFELLGVGFYTGDNYQEFEDEIRDKADLPRYEFKFNSEDSKS